MSDTPTGSTPKPSTAAEIAAQLEDQRRQLAQTVDDITTALHPKTIASDFFAEAKVVAANASDQARAFTTGVRENRQDVVRLATWAAITVVALTGIALIRRNR